MFSRPLSTLELLTKTYSTCLKTQYILYSLKKQGFLVLEYQICYFHASKQFSLQFYHPKFQPEIFHLKFVHLKLFHLIKLNEFQTTTIYVHTVRLLFTSQNVMGSVFVSINIPTDIHIDMFVTV